MGRSGGRSRSARAQARPRGSRWGSIALAVLAFCAGAGVVVALSWEAPPPPPGLTTLAAPGERIRVEVLNGGGVSGMAREATGWLREAGFDVVDLGNADAFDPQRPSAVIDRVGRRELAAAVAQSLGIDIVLSQPDPNLYVDVSVLLGSEWIRPDLRPAPSGAPPREPWDPRGWIGR